GELADSRLENLQRLKSLNLNVPLMLLRMPGLSQVRDTITWADTSLNSQVETITALGIEAKRQGKIHSIVIMVDLGDLREGVLPKDVVNLARQVVSIKGLRLRGLGVNLACYGGVIPSEGNLGQLVGLARDVERETGQRLEVVSGGNSSSLGLLFGGKLPEGITHLRIGEGILLGRETVNRNPLPGAYQDAFILKAEVVEVQVKSSVPKGEIGQDAFGNIPVFTDTGPMMRAIVALGRQDVPSEGIYPLDNRLSIVGASSDHLIIDASKRPGIRVGDIVRFGLCYGGLLGAMTSPFINKRVKEF
ncbi:MAG TPA: alanine/ornithine racemase family PLP-dependent enzyme, partial [Verrucomicrobiae bacterium]|nr:alanine/ornithine racemase family PLP-dependent enzyme [Verrucomicrobiae bacterium]